MGGAVAALIAVGGQAVGGGAATSEPPPIDHDVPINGAPGDGYPRTPLLPAPMPPVQIPLPTPFPDGGDTKKVVYPYISPWLHDAVPVPAGTASEATGTFEVTLPGTRDSVNPSGHCLFVGPGSRCRRTKPGR